MFNCLEIFGNAFAKLLLVVFCCLSTVGCVGFSTTGGPGSNLAPRLKTEADDESLLRAMNSVLLSPVDLSKEVRVQESTPFPFYAELYRTASQELSLEVHGGQEFLEKHYPKMGPGDILQRSIEVGKRNGQDGVLLTKMHRYVEREGSQVGATRFASLDFTMSLYRVKDSKEIWRASYHFRDRPISENIFGINDRIINQDRPGWRRADKALEKGFREALRDLAHRRAKAFESSQVPLRG